jgi:hypothetical protein
MPNGDPASNSLSYFLFCFVTNTALSGCTLNLTTIFYATLPAVYLVAEENVCIVEGLTEGYL